MSFTWLCGKLLLATRGAGESNNSGLSVSSGTLALLDEVGVVEDPLPVCASYNSAFEADSTDVKSSL